MLRPIDNLYRYHVHSVQMDRILYAIALVAATTAVLAFIVWLTDIRHIAIGYVIPVLIAAIRWGVVEAVVAALTATAASAFFFYEPIFDFRVNDTLQIIDLILFLLVAIVTGHFATRLRVEAERANRRERENGALYAFARRLTAAKDASDIYDAIQQHLALLVGRSVLLLGPGTTEEAALERCAHAPARVRETLLAALNRTIDPEQGILVDDGTGEAWLVQAVAPESPAFGVFAINLGSRHHLQVETIRADIDAAMADAAATLQRLGLDRAIDEARSRTESDRLRDALLGSVSHELRTPLASILGAVTTLADAKVVKSDARLSSLVNVAREEAERLNSDIQNLLDATRISSDGVRPKFEWSEPADIVNAASEHRRRRLHGRNVNVRLAPDLPLIYVDSVLIEQALIQVLDNAIKYSPAGTTIDVTGELTNNEVTLSVTDRGAGFSAAEKSHAGERFFRGERHTSVIAGAGLGLWIAKSFVAANAGHLDISSAGEETGSCVSIRLPMAREPEDMLRTSAWSTTDS